MTDAQINQLNLWMRQQPWYQQWFASRGLNPNQVQLTDQQRRELQTLATQNGVPMAGDMKIDEAGNVNEKGGWAGLPTAAKIAILGGAAAATGGALGMFGGAGGGGVGAGGMGPGLNAAAAGSAYNTGPLLMGSGQLLPIGAAAGGAAVPTIGSRLIGNGMSGPNPAANIARGGATLGGTYGGLVDPNGGGGAFSRLLPYLINSGLGLAGSLITQRQISKAVEAQRQASNQVMGLAGNIYQQQRADQQPFYDVGVGATRTLGHLLGIAR